MSGAVEDGVEDESGRDTGVQDTEEDDRRDHEAEADLLVELVADAAECRASHVVATHVGVRDTADDRKDQDLSNGDSPEGLGEVEWLLHLGDKRGDGDLANEGVADIEEGVHASNECSACRREGRNDALSMLGVVRWRVFYRGEYGGKKDGNEGEESGKGCKM